MIDTPTERDATSTWAKLRRRKVVQWGIVYAAGAWGFLQGLEYVTETFQLPDQVRPLATLAFLAINGITIEMPDDEAFELVMSVADGSIDVEQIAAKLEASTVAG